MAKKIRGWNGPKMIYKKSGLFTTYRRILEIRPRTRKAGRPAGDEVVTIFYRRSANGKRPKDSGTIIVEKRESFEKGWKDAIKHDDWIEDE